MGDDEIVGNFTTTLAVDIILVKSSEYEDNTVGNEGLNVEKDWTTNLYSKEFFKPKIIEMHGQQYLMECIRDSMSMGAKDDLRVLEHLFNRDIHVQQRNEQPENIPLEQQQVRQPRWNDLINGEFLWNLTKISLLVYFLTRESSWLRTFFITTVAILVLGIQNGFIPNICMLC